MAEAWKPEFFVSLSVTAKLFQSKAGCKQGEHPGDRDAKYKLQRVMTSKKYLVSESSILTLPGMVAESYVRSVLHIQTNDGSAYGR
jgi:hypothetical protein